MTFEFAYFPGRMGFRGGILRKLRKLKGNLQHTSVLYSELLKGLGYVVKNNALVASFL